MDNDLAICYTFSKSNGVSLSYPEDILAFEQEVIEHKTPRVTSLKPEYMPQELQKDYDGFVNGRLWSWYTTSNTYDICFSVISDDNAPFSHSDIEVLHLLVDTIASRYIQIHLSEALKNKNLRLKEAIAQIELKNREIELINNNQQTIILKRTEELRFKNEKLLELSKLNAHNLREPLSRIMGFLEIAELFDNNGLRNEILPKIKEATEHLDLVFKEVVQQSEEVAVNYKIIGNKYD